MVHMKKPLMEQNSSAEINIYWFRRDLRIKDNSGLYFALNAGLPLLSVFIFDSGILDTLDDRSDPRVMFLYDELVKLHETFRKLGSGLLVKKGNPVDIFRYLTANYRISTVFCNHDYEPYAKKRDYLVGQMLEEKGIRFKTFKDQVIFEKKEILNNQGEPYKVFTPYKNAWLAALTDRQLKSFPSHQLLKGRLVRGPEKILTLRDLGFDRSNISIPSRNLDHDIIRLYHKNREFPAMNGTTRLGIHLRHGTISIREVVRTGTKISQAWLIELIWREFFMTILDFYPEVVDRSFKPQYDRINWNNNEKNFARWCEGNTGYPIVDAGMRQLNQTGYMHNRVRMIVASFLTKHLLIDWRWGEAYFARKLLDYELASNNGGWQWAAGTGTDAQPYFRIFNPAAQTKKYDPGYKYIKRWVPEFQTENYPKPIIDHNFARKRAIDAFKNALN
jgi:deoxyribodipyrimidine photo-lyase